MIMSILDLQKSLLENLYFFSGPILAFLGFVIFKQIKLAKEQVIIAQQQLSESQKQIKINSQRQAATLAAELVKGFIEDIIPLEDKIYLKGEQINYKNPILPVEDFINCALTKIDKNIIDSLKNKPEDIFRLELTLINKVEAFAIYFAKGIADEKVAFASIGEHFCKCVETYYYIISLFREKKSELPAYEDIVELYKCWKGRIKAYWAKIKEEELSEEIMKKMQKLQELNIRDYEDKTITPLGVSD
jgi:hypothetical protein